MIKRFNVSRFIGKNKARFNRGATWASVITMGLLATDIIQRKLAQVNITISFIVLFSVAVVSVWLVGYLDEKFGWFEAEQQHCFDQIPQMKELLRK